MHLSTFCKWYPDFSSGSLVQVVFSDTWCNQPLQSEQTSINIKSERIIERETKVKAPWEISAWSDCVHCNDDMGPDPIRCLSGFRYLHAILVYIAHIPNSSCQG